MTADLNGTLSARQLLLLGLLENLTVYRGRAPSVEQFNGYLMAWPIVRTMDRQLLDAGLIEEVDGCLVRHYTWEPASMLPKPARSGDWALGKARTVKRKGIS